MRGEIHESLRMLGMAALIMLAVVVIVSLCGCTRTVYEPVERVHTEYREADTTAIYNRLLQLFESRKEKETRSDSLIDHTRETVVLKENGDTARHDRERIVYRATTHERELEVENKMLRDSISSLTSRFESIQADTVPRIVPVERKLSRWEQAKMDYGGAALGAWLGILCIAVVWPIKKFRK